eukprot:7376490-Prymnesium_polylepis.1
MRKRSTPLACAVVGKELEAARPATRAPPPVVAQDRPHRALLANPIRHARLRAPCRQREARRQVWDVLRAQQLLVAAHALAAAVGDGLAEGGRRRPRRGHDYVRMRERRAGEQHPSASPSVAARRSR